MGAGPVGVRHGRTLRAPCRWPTGRATRDTAPLRSTGRRTVEELQEIVARRAAVRVLGSRHSFNDIADSDELVSLDRAAGRRRRSTARGTVSFGAGLRYGELAGALEREGLALHNLASLPHISVAGAVATATHGSGDGNGNLATAVAGARAGDLRRRDRRRRARRRGLRRAWSSASARSASSPASRSTSSPPTRCASASSRGSRGTRCSTHFDAITGRGYSVSVFTRWGETIDQVWVKSRVTDAPEDVRDDLFGARPATVDRHPILGIDPVNCTPQLGRPGPWSDRLPHFRMGFTPSAGEELQTEYLVARARAMAAIEAVRGAGRPHPPGPPRQRDPHDRRRPAVDEPAVRARHASAIHFTWALEPDGRRARARRPRGGARAVDPRPHWGKLFLAEARPSRRCTSACRLPRARRAPRPARRVQQRVARAPGARRAGLAVAVPPALAAQELRDLHRRTGEDRLAVLAVLSARAARRRRSARRSCASKRARAPRRLRLGGILAIS